MARIENREMLNQLSESVKKEIDSSKCRILICAGTGCLAGGSATIFENMVALTKDNGKVDVAFGPEIAHPEGMVHVKKSGCHGFCEMGPLMRIEPQGILYIKVKPEDCEEMRSD